MRQPCYVDSIHRTTFEFIMEEEIALELEESIDDRSKTFGKRNIGDCFLVAASICIIMAFFSKFGGKGSYQQKSARMTVEQTNQLLIDHYNNWK